MYSKIQEMEDFVVESIERHREMLDPSAPKDFIDSFLVRMDKARAELDGGGWVGGKQSDGHTTDTELIYLGMMRVIFKR